MERASARLRSRVHALPSHAPADSGVRRALACGGGMRRTSAARRSKPSERRVGTVRGPHSRRCGCTTAPPATRRRSSARLGRELRIARRIPQAFDLAKKPEDAVRLDLGGRAGNGNAARPMRGCAGCPTSRREPEPAPFHHPGRRTAKLPPAGGGVTRVGGQLLELMRAGDRGRTGDVQLGKLSAHASKTWDRC